MDVTKIIKATAVRGRTSTAASVIKEDHGLYLLIGGIDLPEVYEVDFSNDEHAGTSVTMVGNADGVLIPTQFIKSGKDVFAFYYHVGEDFGRTLYTIRIPNKLRPDRTDEEPTPEEQSVIDQAIIALNTAVAKTAQDVISADQSARSASNDADRAERARTGAETARGKAEEAQESAERAKDDAETSERNASESERKAKGYAETASEKADAITGLTATATTLPDGSQASASYNAETGVMSFGIPKGKDGTDGDDGYSPTANVSKTGKVATITITDKNGTTSAQVEDGTDGIDGISPSVSVTDITGGHRVVITDKDGAKSFDVEDGATGATPNLTIGTVETLDPTDDATATITGTPENPVLNFGIPQGDAGEVTTEEFLKAFPTDTASGAIASFSDGADDLPLKSLVVNIDPVQDLHGQANPYPAGGGKNKFDKDNATTLNGVYLNYSNNTLSASSPNRGIILPIVGGNTYTVSFQSKNATDLCVASFSDVPAVGSVCLERTTTTSDVTGKTMTLATSTSATYIFVKTNNINNTQTYTDEQILAGLQVEIGTTATAWSPYENICPISGWTEIGVEHTGGNLWDGLNYTSGSYLIVTGDTNRNVPYGYTDYIPVAPDSTYYVSGISGSNPSICWYDNDKNFIGGEKNDGATSKTISVPSNAHFIRVSFLLDNVDTLMVNYPATDHDYHPYSGRSITINIGQTVYGGKLDVLSGELVIDMIMQTVTGCLGVSTSSTGVLCASIVTSINAKAEAISNNNISSAYKFRTNAPTDGGWFRVTTTTIFIYDNRFTDKATADAILATEQPMFVYELRTPITIQLTPNQVNSLLGVNNIWADSGDTEVVYRADTKLFIERLTAPVSADMIADANITSGQYFMVGNSLYKATTNIANGSAIIVGTNCIRKSLSEALNEINA